MFDLNTALRRVIETDGSDLHLKVGSRPVVRVDGHLVPLTDQKRLMQEDTIALAFSMMSARQKQKFKDNFEIDMAYSVPGLGRFRCSVFQQRGTVGLVLRVIPVKILTIRELLLTACGLFTIPHGPVRSGVMESRPSGGPDAADVLPWCWA